jgi:cystathionine gamma-lyase
MRDETKIVRSGLTESRPGTPMHAGPVFAAAFHSPGDPSAAAYTYTRSGNPTWTHLEAALNLIEGNEENISGVLVFSSGMAATTAVFGALLRPGDTVFIPSDAYFLARTLVNEHLAAMGIGVRSLPTSEMRRDNPAFLHALEGAKLLWIETPSNPGMVVANIAELGEAAHSAGALLAVDNTTPTAFGQRPLLLGADLSIASDAKAMTGHGDILLGHVAVRDEILYRRVLHQRTLTGGILGPMEAWLALRSLVTLPLRLERQSANALALARLLSEHASVCSVHYPGLPSHPGHAIARMQMQHFGPVLSFELPSKETAENFLTHAVLITEATSFGGVITTAERRARWGGDAVPEGFIRMSAGCEAIEDLLADVAQALDKLG